MDPKVDALLYNYLRDQAPDVVKRLERIERKVDNVEDLGTRCLAATQRVANHQIDTDQRVARHGRRLRAVEIEAERRSAAEPGENWQAEAREITGSFELRKLQEAEQERRSEHKWLRRKRREWVMAALGALALVALTTVVSAYTARAVSAPAPVTHQRQP